MTNQIKWDLDLSPCEYPDQIRDIYYKNCISQRTNFSSWVDDLNKDFKNEVDWWLLFPSSRNPNYSKLAKSFWINAIKCNSKRTLPVVIDYFINFDGPILCEFNIKKDICLPLVGPGKALDDMILPEEATIDTIQIEGGEVPS